jgi:glycine cleavage system transcriptional repressor
MVRARPTRAQGALGPRFHRQADPGTLPESPAAFPRMKQFIAISAIGDDRIGLVHDLSRVVADCGGSISESRMAALGSDFAMLMLVAGNWHSVARIETDLAKLAEASGITIQVRRTTQRAAREDMVPYSVDVVCIDQAGIVSGLSGFFAARGIDIGELSTRSYAAAHTGAQMFSVYMVVNVPSRIHVGALREEFMDFCDQMNLDAILEPVKN